MKKIVLAASLPLVFALSACGGAETTEGDAAMTDDPAMTDPAMDPAMTDGTMATDPAMDPAMTPDGTATASPDAMATDGTMAPADGAATDEGM